MSRHPIKTSVKAPYQDTPSRHQSRHSTKTPNQDTKQDTPSRDLSRHPILPIEGAAALFFFALAAAPGFFFALAFTGVASESEFTSLCSAALDFDFPLRGDLRSPVGEAAIYMAPDYQDTTQDTASRDL